jgi:hypothetical protein
MECQGDRAPRLVSFGPGMGNVGVNWCGSNSSVIMLGGLSAARPRQCIPPRCGFARMICARRSCHPRINGPVRELTADVDRWAGCRRDRDYHGN